jgi:signal transduction histidine kinase
VNVKAIEEQVAPACAHLAQQLTEARAMAFKVMTASSEMGQALQFVKHSFQLHRSDQLARELLDFLANMGLRGSLLIHEAEGHSFFSLADDSFLDEARLLQNVHGGRIVSYPQGFIVNYPHCALLVENLPDDACRVGELRDTLAILMDAVEARVWSLLLQKQADDARRLKDAFIELISHELRTPLNPIVGFATRLEKRLASRLDTKELQALHAIKDHAEDLRRTVDDMLEMQRVELGQLALDKQLHDMGDLVRRALQRAEPLMDRYHTHLQLGAIPTFSIYGDGARLIELIYGLLCNAHRFGAGGPVGLSVASEGAGMAGMVVVTVSDQGPGIALDQQSLIFKHFLERKTPTSLTEPSDGISLYLCKAIAEQHKGRLTVHSELGAGASFRLQLPIFSDACN